VGARVAAPELLYDHSLVIGVAKGEEEADRDRLRVDLRKGREIEWAQLALRAHAL